MATILNLDPTATPSDGDTLAYDAATQKWLPATGGTGEAGPAGPQGEPGPAGPQGPAGADGADGAAAVLGPDDNYVTDAEKTKLANLSGTNTGDQTLPTWTTLSGKPSTFAPTIGATSTTAVAGNDSRLTNARTPTAHTHPVGDLTATGTKDATTFLRGDNTWAVPAGGGSDPWTYVVATADTANATMTAVNATGLSIPALANGLYEFEVLALCTSTVTTTGAQVGLTIAGASGATVTAFNLASNGATGAIFHFPGSSQLPLGGAALNAPTTSSQYVGSRMEGVIRAASMTGTIDVTIASENTSSVSVKADSFIRYRKIAN